MPETPRGTHETTHADVVHETTHADVARATTLADVARAAIDGRPLRLVLGTLAERVRPRRRLLWFSGGLAAVLVALAPRATRVGVAGSLGAGSVRGSPVPTGSSAGSSPASSPGSPPGSSDSSPASLDRGIIERERAVLREKRPPPTTLRRPTIRLSRRQPCSSRAHECISGASLTVWRARTRSDRRYLPTSRRSTRARGGTRETRRSRLRQVPGIPDRTDGQPGPHRALLQTSEGSQHGQALRG